MSDNAVGERIVDEAMERTLRWANAMREWLIAYESHINELVTEKKLPKPPRW